MFEAAEVLFFLSFFAVLGFELALYHLSHSANKGSRNS
jgi:hypothetical protein